MTELGVGDVLCTRGGSWVSRTIRFGAAILGRPNTVSHVAIYMGLGSDDRPQVIEARPGGVGWLDATEYLKSHWTIDNREQPKTEEQRKQIHDAAIALLGTPYDWVGIGQNAMEAIRAPDLYRSKAWMNKASPNHVVCSSLADWVYAEVKLANPGKTQQADKITTPGDWAEFCITKAWEK
jgi:cell wall-associated NlpC family hydrolase